MQYEYDLSFFDGKRNFDLPTLIVSHTDADALKRLGKKIAHTIG